MLLNNIFVHINFYIFLVYRINSLLIILCSFVELSCVMKRWKLIVNIDKKIPGFWTVLCNKDTGFLIIK